jgi:endoglucanase
MGLRTFRPGKGLLAAVSSLLLCMGAGCKERTWTLWNSYSARFIDTQGRVFDARGDQHTTSEGQAYAMFFALVDNDRGCFDRVLNWTQANLAQGDLHTHLPAWQWGKDKDGQWKALDPNSASDADTWMAYTLVEAGRLWDEPSYADLGRSMMALIAQKEVADLPGFGPMLLPGATGFQHGKSTTLNPSYLPEFIFARLGVVDPAGEWAQIAKGIPTLILQSSRHGYAMDWVDYYPGDGFYPVAKPSAANQATAANDGPGGSYDAIRVYLWAGMMDKSPARAAILNAVPEMSVYLANHDAPPEMVSEDGVPLEHDGPIGFSAAVLPYLRAYRGLSREVGRQLVRMDAERNPSSGLYGKDPRYYDQNLALFATGFLDGRFRFGPEGKLKVEWKRR